MADCFPARVGKAVGFLLFLKGTKMRVVNRGKMSPEREFISHMREEKENELAKT